jgi:hypothetical protein
MTEEELKEQMKKALSESLDVDAVMNLYMDQMENMFLKGFELGVKELMND